LRKEVLAQICYHLSLNSLNYKLRKELVATDLPTPLVQLVRLQVGHGAPNLRFVKPLVQLLRPEVGNRPPNLGFVDPSSSTPKIADGK